MSGGVELRRQFGAITADDGTALDRAALAAAVSVEQLMEIAGWQVARCAWHVLHEAPGAVMVVAGGGNNGGDALVAARHLETWGCQVRVHRVGKDEALALPGACESASLVIDGILGTGLRAAPREPQAAVIRAVNAAATPVLAIDVPSGLDATTGQPYEPCVRARATCTLAAVKAGLWAPQAAAPAGDIWAADIGMPLAAWRACGLQQPTALVGGALLRVPATTAE